MIITVFLPNKVFQMVYLPVVDYQKICCVPLGSIIIPLLTLPAIGGQRGGGGPSPPPFHKNWSEKATKRVNFSKFS